jgi:hypothetical protein
MPWWAIVLIAANTLGLAAVAAFVIWMFGRADKAYYLSMSLNEAFQLRKDLWDEAGPRINRKIYDIGERIRKLEETNAQEPMGRAPD